RRHTRWPRDWSSDVCSSDLVMSRTQPNRMYLMAATTAGHVHPLNETHSPPLANQTIFDALQKGGISWKIYVSDLDRNPPVQDSEIGRASGRERMESWRVDGA